MTPRDWHLLVSQDLGIEPSPDWGIINADPLRIAEFILYSKSKNLPKFIEYIFVELIIASMDRAIAEDIPLDRNTVIEFNRYIENILFDESFYPQVSYWLGLNPSEFPVGAYLLKLAGDRLIVS